MSMTPDFDLLVIGGGAVGLAVAAEAAARLGGENVILLERHRRIGQETSSRSSDVVHACLYYPPGTHKAKFCLEGAQRLLSFCETEGVACRRFGKLIVAQDDSELPAMEALKRNAEACGVEGIEIVDRSCVHRMEPLVDGLAALWSPNTAIFDSWEFMQRLKARFLALGGELVLRAEVVGIDLETGLVTVRRPGGETEELRVGLCVNSAGLQSDWVASLAGLDRDALGLRLLHCKGSYFSVTGRIARSIGRLVYPVPGHLSGGLGLHFTPDLGGGLRLGPNASYVSRQDPPDYSVDVDLQDAFLDAGRRLVPTLRGEDLAPDMAGIRPRLYAPGEPARDFEIVFQQGSKAAAIHLVGIESPGLTASLALGRHVASSAVDLMG